MNTYRIFTASAALTLWLLTAKLPTTAHAPRPEVITAPQPPEDRSSQNDPAFRRAAELALRQYLDRVGPDRSSAPRRLAVMRDQPAQVTIIPGTVSVDQSMSDCPLSVAMAYVSQHFVQTDQTFDPIVRVSVLSSSLDPARGDHLYNVGGGSFNAWPVQPVHAIVAEGDSYTFDVANDSGFRMTAPANEGSYTSRWQMKVNGNLIGPEAALQIVVDHTPPGITITAPAGGAYLNASAITIQANPSDARSGVDQVEFFAGYDDGSGWAWHSLGWDAAGGDGWSTVWNASGVTDQTPVAVYAHAWDKSGNGAGIANWDLTLDRTAPTTSIQLLAAAQNSTAFVVVWNRGDNLSGIDHVDLQAQMDGGAWQAWATITGTVYYGKWFYGDLGHAYAFRMRGIDRAGNVEAYPPGAETSTFINPCAGDTYEPDNAAANAQPITVDGPLQSHTFCGVNDADWIKFYATAGHRYIIRTSDLGATTDTVLTLYAADGSTVLAENDDSLNSLASWIEWLAQSDGGLYVRARDWDGRVAGSAVTYNVRVQTGYRVDVPIVAQ